MDSSSSHDEIRRPHKATSDGFMAAGTGLFDWERRMFEADRVNAGLESCGPVERAEPMGDDEQAALDAPLARGSLWQLWKSQPE